MNAVALRGQNKELSKSTVTTIHCLQCLGEDMGLLCADSKEPNAISTAKKAIIIARTCRSERQ